MTNTLSIFTKAICLIVAACFTVTVIISTLVVPTYGWPGGSYYFVDPATFNINTPDATVIKFGQWEWYVIDGPNHDGWYTDDTSVALLEKNGDFGTYTAQRMSTIGQKNSALDMSARNAFGTLGENEQKAALGYTMFLIMGYGTSLDRHYEKIANNNGLESVYGFGHIRGDNYSDPTWYLDHTLAELGEGWWLRTNLAHNSVQNFMSIYTLSSGGVAKGSNFSTSQASQTLYNRPVAGLDLNSVIFLSDGVSEALSVLAVTFPQDLYYTGQPHEPEPTITLDGEVLVRGVDYELENWQNNVNANWYSYYEDSGYYYGEGDFAASVDVVGLGRFSGVSTHKFIIEKIPVTIKADDITTGVSPSQYPQWTFTVDGLVDGETKDDVFQTYPTIYNPAGVSWSTVGVYPNVIKPQGGVLKPNGNTYQDPDCWHGVPCWDNCPPKQNSNYYIDGYVNGTLTLERETDWEIIVEDQTYNGRAQEPMLSYKSKGMWVTVGANEDSIVWEDNKDVGTAKVTVTASGNYAGTYTKEFQIKQKNLTVRADDKTASVGDSVPELTYSTQGLVNNETKADAFQTQPTLSTTATMTATGNFPINISGGVSKNYNVTYNTGTLSVTAQDIAAASIDPIPAYTYTGMNIEPLPVVKANGVTLVKDVDYTLSYSDNKNASVNTATVTVTGKTKFNGTKTITFDILKAPLTLKIDSKVAVMGDSLPELTYTAEGLVNNETKSDSLQTQPTLSTTATMQAEGHFPINGTGGVSQNYSFVIVSGTLTVMPKNMNDVNIQATFEPKTYTGLAHTPDPTSITFDGKAVTKGVDYTLSYVDNVNAGQATVTITGEGNYIGMAQRTFTINKAPLTVKADDKSTVAGNTVGALTYTVTGRVNGETNAQVFTVMPSVDCPTANINVPGTYTIRLLGSASDNYEVTRVNGTLTVSAASISAATIEPIPDHTYNGQNIEPLPVVKVGGVTLIKDVDYTVSYSNNKNATTATSKAKVNVTGMGKFAGLISADFVIDKKLTSVTPKNVTITVGGALPATFEYTVLGMVAGETAADVITNTPVPHSPTANVNQVGEYPIVWQTSPTAGANYRIAGNSGTLTVSPKNLSNMTVEAEFADVVFNHARQTPPPINGVKFNGEPVTEDVDYTLTYPVNSTAAGTYTVTITGIGKYGGTATRTYQITKLPITVTANDVTIKVGDPQPDLTGNITMSLGSVTPAWKDSFTLTVKDLDVNTIGDYEIEVSGGSSLFNYSVTYVSGTLTVRPISLSTDGVVIEAEFPNRVYNGLQHTPDPIDGVKFNGVAVTNGTDYTLTYGSGRTNVGTYTVTINGIGKYSGSTQRTYQITPAPITLTAADRTITFGNTGYSLGYTVTGNKNGEPNSTVIATAPTRTHDPITTVGTYPITIEGGSVSSNYEIVSRVNGTLTVNRRNLDTNNVNIEAEFPTLTYNGQNQTPDPVNGVKFDNVAVTKGVDYTLSYSNNKNATTATSKATVTITGIGNYAGSKSFDFEIEQKEVAFTTHSKQMKFGEQVPEFTHHVTGLVSGETEDDLWAVRPTLSSFRAAEANYAAGSYQITRKVSPTNSTLTGTFTSNYKYGGSLAGILTIHPLDFTDDNVVIEAAFPNQVYNGQAHEPNPTGGIKFNGVAVTKGVDYTLTYTNNVNAGPATVTITGIGNYDGTATRSFTIGQRPVQVQPNNKTVTVGTALPLFDYVVTGIADGETESDVWSTAPTFSSPEANPYTVAGMITKVGQYQIRYVTSVVKNNYSATYYSGELNVIAKNFGDMVIDATFAPEVYTGLAHTPDPTSITFGGENVTKGVDYTLNYVDNVNAGPATVTITGIGKYSGTATRTFQIAKAPLTITAVYKQATVGDPMPALTYSLSGVKNSEAIDKVFTTEPTLSCTPNMNVASTYPITVSGAQSDNYELTYSSGTLRVWPRNLDTDNVNIEADFPNQVYNGQAHEPNPTGGVKFNNVAVVKDVDYTLTYTDNINAGPATVTITGIGNYAGQAEKTFTIDKRPVSVRVRPETMTLGDEVPTFVISWFGQALPQGESYSDVCPDTSTFTLTCNPDLTTAGEYPITISGGELTANYYIAEYRNGTLTILPKNVNDANVTVTMPNNLVYNGLEQEPEPTSVKLGSLTLVKDVDYEITGYANNKNATTSASKASITIKGIGNNFTGTKTVDFEIGKAPIRYTAQDRTMTYGGTVPELTYTVSGRQNNEPHTVTILTYPTLTHDPIIGVGTYTITISGGAVNDNYYISDHVNGTLTVTAANVNSANVTVTMPSDLVYNGLYQEPDPTGVTLGSIELVKGVDYEIAGYANNKNATSSVNEATITIEGIGSNFTGTKTVKFEIGRKGVTVRADNKTITLGDPLPEFTITITGMVEGETYEDVYNSLPQYHSPTANVNKAGTYPIVRIIGSGNLTRNYSANSGGGMLTVEPKNIDTDDVVVVATFTDLTYTGMAQRPTPTNISFDGLEVDETQYFLTNYKNNTDAGTATVDVVGKGNYAGRATVEFTIDKADLTITADDKTATMGGAEPVYTYTVTGKVNDETNAQAFTTLPTVNSPTANMNQAAKYMIRVTGGTSDNYNITRQSAILTVEPKNLDTDDVVVVATFTNLTYTGQPQKATPTNISFDGVEVDEEQYFLTNYKNNTDAGTATVDVVGKGNYAGRATVEFTIGKADLTITADDKEATIGTTEPYYTYTATGMVNDETAEEAIQTEPNLTSNVNINVVGTYQIFAANATSKNYEIEYVDGALTVVEAEEVDNGDEDELDNNDLEDTGDEVADENDEVADENDLEDTGDKVADKVNPQIVVIFDPKDDEDLDELDLPEIPLQRPDGDLEDAGDKVADETQIETDNDIGNPIEGDVEDYEHDNERAPFTGVVLPIMAAMISFSGVILSVRKRR